MALMHQRHNATWKKDWLGVLQQCHISALPTVTSGQPVINKIEDEQQVIERR